MRDDRCVESRVTARTARRFEAVAGLLTGEAGNCGDTCPGSPSGGCAPLALPTVNRFLCGAGGPVAMGVEGAWRALTPKTAGCLPGRAVVDVAADMSEGAVEDIGRAAATGSEVVFISPVHFISDSPY